MSKVDLELKKAFAELQEKKIETEQNLRILQMNIETLKRAKQHALITERELSLLDSNTKMYDSVGRMFIFTPKTEVEENLKKKHINADEKIKNLEYKMTGLESSLKEATNSLRELVQQKKEA